MDATGKLAVAHTVYWNLSSMSCIELVSITRLLPHYLDSRQVTEILPNWSDDLSKMMMSLIKHQAWKISDDHNGKPKVLGIFQLRDKIVGTVNSGLHDAAFAHAAITHIAARETLTLGELLQTKPSYREYQASAN